MAKSKPRKPGKPARRIREVTSQQTDSTGRPRNVMQDMVVFERKRGGQKPVKGGGYK